MQDSDYILIHISFDFADIFAQLNKFFNLSNSGFDIYK
jgi:hypothetical protein